MTLCGGSEIDNLKAVVLDTGCFINLQRLEKYDFCDLHVSNGVANEIRDVKARQHVKTLVDLPRISSPTEGDLKFVRYFAKLTGDLGFLSETDLELAALTYMLQRKTGNTSNLKVRPESRVCTRDDQCVFDNVRFEWENSFEAQDSTIAEMQASSLFLSVNNDTGVPKDENDSKHLTNEEGTCNADSICKNTNCTQQINEVDETALSLLEKSEALGSCKKCDTLENCSSVHTTVNPLRNSVSEQTPDNKNTTPELKGLTTNYENDVADCSEDDSSEAGEWITKDTINWLNSQTSSKNAAPSDCRPYVACMTNDYTLQNLHLQMGLKILNIDGLEITSVKLWGKLCRTCFSFTKDTTKLFCRSCGQPNYSRVPYRIDEKGGVVVIHPGRPSRKAQNKIHTLGFPTPGRHGNDPILAEDQLFMNGRDRQYRHLCNLWKKEQMKHDPFEMNSAVYDEASWCSRKFLPAGGMEIKGRPIIRIGGVQKFSRKPKRK